MSITAQRLTEYFENSTMSRKTLCKFSIKIISLNHYISSNYNKKQYNS